MIKIIVFIKRKIDKLKEEFKFSSMAYEWRKKNRHNKTFVLNFFPVNKVIVGHNTYGMLDVRFFCEEANESLIIGNYVSIADDVIFILGGEHQMKSYTTFPLKAYFSRVDNTIDSFSKGPIHIEDEVWIGTGVKILSGVTIGKGAIVGAGAVVTKNILPYTIVAGNPAKLIKFRFDEFKIKQLNSFKLIDLDANTIQENIDLFYQNIETNQEVLDSIIVLKKEVK